MKYCVKISFLTLILTDTFHSFFVAYDKIARKIVRLATTFGFEIINFSLQFTVGPGVIFVVFQLSFIGKIAKSGCVGISFDIHRRFGNVSIQSHIIDSGFVHDKSALSNLRKSTELCT